MEKKPTYRLKHVGINSPDLETAKETADTLCHLFGEEVVREIPVSFFTTSLFEVMKQHRPEVRGVHGHIGLQTDDVEAAMADLSARGITFQEDSIKRDENGRITFVYLEQQVAGFAFHIGE